MQINEILSAEKKEIQKSKDSFHTGLSDVDMIIDGIAPGEIMLVSSPPSFGATGFCITAALFTAGQNNIKTLYLTSERPAYLAKRLVGIGVGAPLYIEQIEGVSFDEIDEAIPSDMELIFQGCAYEIPAEETEDLDPVEKYFREVSPWLCIIDSIDYIYKYYPRQGRYEVIRCELLQKAISEIKRLAKKYNAAVIITADTLRSTSDEPAELSREVASCAPLVERLCLLDWDRENYLQKAVFEVLKNDKFVTAVISLGIDQGSRMLTTLQKKADN